MDTLQAIVRELSHLKSMVPVRFWQNTSIKVHVRSLNFSVQILEKVKGSGRTECEALDATSTTLRKQRELHWMLKLRTVFPYGLNDRIGDEFKTQEAQFAIATRFPALKRTKPRIAHGIARKGHTNLTCNTGILLC